MTDQEKQLFDTKFFLIEYGTMFAMYDGIDDIGPNRSHYDFYISKACDSQLRMINYAIHNSQEEKDDMKAIVLQAHRELIEKDFGKSIEEL